MSHWGMYKLEEYHNPGLLYISGLSVTRTVRVLRALDIKVVFYPLSTYVTN